MTLTIFEKSQKGQRAYSLPRDDAAFKKFHPPSEMLRKDPIDLPEISEIDITRHFNTLADRNVGIDNTFVPLGSCTMKLNPRANEYIAAIPQFTRTHPLAPVESVQGNLQVICELIEILCQLSGMTAGTLAPNAGAQGEFTGIRMIAEYHKKAGDLNRTEIIVPDSAHGTNPATAAMTGFKVVTIPTDAKGDLNLEILAKSVSDKTAGLMLTNPNTLGLFSPNILKIAEIVHKAGGLLYYDGANLNPIVNIAKPGDMGFDVMHINLHKTFSTPHGGGGPGSGPVLCNSKLAPFLPVPYVVNKKGHYDIVLKAKDSIGRMASFHGNFGIYLRAYMYAKLHGNYGLRRNSEIAVLNANYLKARLGKYFTVPHPQNCMHEFVIQTTNYLDKNLRATDFAKRLLDYGFYAPSVYFPLIVKECMLIEPTESESKKTLDSFVEALEKIVTEDPEIVKSAPHTTPVSRLDEVLAAKKPILRAFTTEPRRSEE